MGMEEWKEYKLGDVCQRLKSGKSIKADQILRQGKYPVIGGNGLRGYTNEPNFIGEAAIIGRQGAYCGNVRYFKGAGYMTEHAIVLVGNKLTNTKYLSCKLSLMQLGHLSAQSAQPGLSVQLLSKLPIILPSIEKQNIIANIIQTLDNKIELNRRINENLEQQAQALFKSWFVDFEPFKDGKFVDSELGMIPEGWKVYELGNLCDSISMTHPCKKGELIFLNTGDIENGSVLTNKYMNIKDMPGQAKKSIKENDILYSEIRPINRHYAFVNFPAHEYIVSTKLMVIRAIDKKLAIRLYQYLTSDDVINELQHEAESRSGTFPQIRFENIKKIKILIGPNDIENQYTEFIENIYKMIFQYREEVIKLEHLRDTLLPKLMSGELKINNFNN
jgi:type I restriction enzyme S subunit